MRVFLVQTAHGLTAASGGYKLSIGLLRQVSSFGHKTTQICYGTQTEVDQFAQRAADNGLQPNLATSYHRVVDPQGQDHNLWIKTFTSEDNVEYIVVDSEVFEKAYPSEKLFHEIQGYLDVSAGGDKRVDIDAESNKGAII